MDADNIVPMDSKYRKLHESINSIDDMIKNGSIRSCVLLCTTTDEVQHTYIVADDPYVVVGAMESIKNDVLNRCIE